jgi:hypothetical protein
VSPESGFEPGLKVIIEHVCGFQHVELLVNLRRKTPE